MDNERHGIRASGVYATYNGSEYLAQDMRDRVRLLSDDDPLPAGFEISAKSWVRGEAIVPRASVERLRKMRTTCVWRGFRFEVGIIVGDMADVTYLGTDFDDASDLPGMQRPDKYEVGGTIAVSELAEVEECFEQQGPEADIADALRSRMRRGDGLRVPYARRWEVGGCQAIHSVRSYPYDGLLVLGRGLSELNRRPVFAATDRLIVMGYPRVCWVAANRDSRGDGPPDSYLVGRDGEHTARYVGNSAEVVVEIVRGMWTGTRRPPTAGELQIGFPGVRGTATTYVGSWQWDVHGEAGDDEFLQRAASATLTVIEAKKERDAGQQLRH
jgi:hypothetical protein